MRAFDEIKADVQLATEKGDTSRLRELADELHDLQTPDAEALEHDTRGLAYNFTGYYAEALSCYNRSLPIYQQLADQDGIAKVTGHIGMVHHGTGDYPRALEYFRASRELFEQLGDRESVARANSNIGVVLFITGSHAEALEYYDQVLAFFTELGNRNWMARAIGNIGVVYASTGAYPEAIDYYYRALAIHEELGHRSLVALTIDNIGLIYSYTGTTAEALDHYQRALAIYEELGNRAGQAKVIDHIGTVHSQTGAHKEALDHYLRALAIHEELGDRASVAIATGSIGAALMELDRIDEARAIADTFNTMDVLNPRCRISRHVLNALLLTHDEQYDDAAEKYRSALDEANEHGLRVEMANIHESLRDLARKRNDFEGYIEHNDAYMKITEEVRGKEATQRMVVQAKEREMASERRERDRELAVLYSALPKHVADRVVRGEKVSGDHYDNAAILFLDIVGFTAISDQLSPGEVVHLLERIFTTLDEVCRGHGITKIKTIGDSYMAAAFESDGHILRAAQAALDMISVLDALDDTFKPIRVRIGLDCGPVTAGVIGTERLQYDVWGDTVNIASRMENTSESGRIHVSTNFALALQHDSSREPGALMSAAYSLLPRGEIEVKGKGLMMTYWLES